ncbi:hypothetical protein HK100_000183 [Physocladia obscura]|uniref:DENN-domain-containing protein n=1 Tax=Physocladia obscura TaxID=109957 RepID=A0AAD5XFS7_9FUNG|nr:hypothetical protein HK100_000183 [Physocladia obscura]
MPATVPPIRTADYFFQVGLPVFAQQQRQQEVMANHLSSLRRKDCIESDATISAPPANPQQAFKGKNNHYRVISAAQSNRSISAAGTTVTNSPRSANLLFVAQQQRSNASSSSSDDDSDTPLNILAPKLRAAHVVTRDFFGGNLRINTAAAEQNDAGTNDDDHNVLPNRSSGAVTPAHGRMKRKHPIDYIYDSRVICRFPETNYSGHEAFPESVAMFCFPNGLKFFHDPDNIPEATCHSFVTIASEGFGDKSYGVCLTFYEKIQEPLLSQLEELIEEWRQECIANTDMEYLQYLQSQLAINQERILKAKSGIFTSQPIAEPQHHVVGNAHTIVTDNDVAEILIEAEEKVNLFRDLLKTMDKVMPIDLENVYVPRCVGLLSRWPFYDVFGDWLKEVVMLVKGLNNKNRTVSPSGSDYSQIGGSNIPLERLLINFLYEVPLPPPGRVEVKITIGRYNLFCSRPPVNSIQVLQNHYSMLTLACESISLLLYPFSWQYHYIPILPADGMKILQATMPFIIGVNKEYFYRVEELDPDWKTELAIIDLDKNTLESDCNPPQIPPKDRRKLVARLLKYSGAQVASTPPAPSPLSPTPQPIHQHQHGKSIVYELPPKGVPITTRYAYPNGTIVPRSAVSRRWLAQIEIESEITDGQEGVVGGGSEDERNGGGGGDETQQQRRSSSLSSKSGNAGLEIITSESFAAGRSTELLSTVVSQSSLENSGIPTSALLTHAKRTQSTNTNINQVKNITTSAMQRGSLESMKVAMSRLKFSLPSRTKSPVVSKSAAMDDDDVDSSEVDSVKGAVVGSYLSPLKFDSESTAEVERSSDLRLFSEKMSRSEYMSGSTSMMMTQRFSEEPASFSRKPAHYATSITSSITTSPTYYDPSLAPTTTTTNNNPKHSSFSIAESTISLRPTSAGKREKTKLHEGHAFYMINLDDTQISPFGAAKFSKTDAIDETESIFSETVSQCDKTNHEEKQLLTAASNTAGGANSGPFPEKRKSGGSLLNALSRSSKSNPSIYRASNSGAPSAVPISTSQTLSSPTASELALNTATESGQKQLNSAEGLSSATTKPPQAPVKPLMPWKGDSNDKPEDSMLCRICLENLKCIGDITALKCQYCKSTIHHSCLQLIEGSPCITFFNEKKIQYSFFKVFTSLLKSYRTYMVMPEKLKLAKEKEAEKGETGANIIGLDLGPDDWFRKADFLAGADRESRVYLTHIVETQNFVQFTLERVELPESDYEILFFDESIKAKLNRSKLKFSKETTPFLKDGAYSIRATITALPPNSDGLDKDKTYTMSLFPVTIDKSLLGTPRKANPLVTEADQNMMRSHTNELVNRTHIANNKRKQDFSKWMRSKLKNFQRPENRLNVEMLTDEQRRDLFEQKLKAVSDTVGIYESAHLSTQSNAELQDAIEDLHTQQYLLIDMTEAELVDADDQDEYKSVTNRLLQAMTLYKEHLFALENPEYAPTSVPRSRASTYKRSITHTELLNDSERIHIHQHTAIPAVLVRSRSESLRKPAGSSQNNSPSSTRAMRFPSTSGTPAHENEDSGSNSPQRSPLVPHRKSELSTSHSDINATQNRKLSTNRELSPRAVSNASSISPLPCPRTPYQDPPVLLEPPTELQSGCLTVSGGVTDEFESSPAHVRPGNDSSTAQPIFVRPRSESINSRSAKTSNRPRNTRKRADVVSAEKFDLSAGEIESRGSLIHENECTLLLATSTAIILPEFYEETSFENNSDAGQILRLQGNETDENGKFSAKMSCENIVQEQVKPELQDLIEKTRKIILESANSQIQTEQVPPIKESADKESEERLATPDRKESLEF